MTVDADLEADENLFGKVPSDLQEDIEIGTSAIEGTLKYVDDYSSDYGTGEDSGNYLVLHCEVPDVEDVTISVELVGGVHGPQVLDPDGIIIIRVTDKNSQTVKVVASHDDYGTYTRTFSLEGLTLAEAGN